MIEVWKYAERGVVDWRACLEQLEALARREGLNPGVHVTCVAETI